MAVTTRLETVWQDVVFGVRLALRNRAFAVVAVLTIAIGIAGTTSVFSIVNAVLIEPLPYARAGEMYQLSNIDPERGLRNVPVSFTKLSRLQHDARTTDAVAGFWSTTVVLKNGPLPEQIQSAQVTREFFDVFSITPTRGRTFSAAEDAPGGAPVVVLSDRFWKNRLGGDPNAVGKQVSLDGQSVTVIGILPATFKFPFQDPAPEVWLPRIFDNPGLGTVRVHTGAGYISVYARTKAGVRPEVMKAEMEAINAAYRQDNQGFADTPELLEAVPLKEALVGPVEPSLMVLLTAVTCVLLIGCTNLMSLLLAKANGRVKELAIRSAMGATRARMVRQMLTESMVLSLTGGVLGIAIATAAISALKLLPPGTLPRSEEVRLSPAMLLLSTVVSLGAGIFFGLLPALRSSKDSIAESLKENSRGTTGNARARRMRGLLIGGEVALAVLLLSGAGVLVRSFTKLLHVDPGFEGRGVLTMTIPLPVERYPLEKGKQFFRTLLAEVKTLPQAKSVSAVNGLPLVGSSPLVYCCAEGAACKGVGKDPLIETRIVTPEYFQTMSIPLLRGRLFEETDDENGQRVVIISEASAKKFFPGQDPMGKTLANSRDMNRMVIVGVVKDVRALSLSREPFPEMYMPHLQNQRVLPTMTLLVRTDGAMRPMVDAIKKKVAQQDADVPVADEAMLDQSLSAVMAQPRLTTQVAGMFAAVALLLTVIGIYGVLAYSVSQQTPEIGIRIALGATPRRVVNLVLREGLTVVFAGMVAGVVGSLVLTRLMKSVLFETSERDPVTLMVTIAIVGAVGFLASYVPALKASRTDPNITLR